MNDRIGHLAGDAALAEAAEREKPSPPGLGRGSYNVSMELFGIIVAVSLPWVIPTVWYVRRSGLSVLDGRSVDSQASRLRAFGR